MKKIELDHFCNISYVSGLTPSPEGSKLCFVKSIADLDNNKYVSNLWLYETGKFPRQLTTSGKDKKAIWLNDTEILFTSSREADVKKPGTSLYKMNIHGGEAQLVFKTCHDLSKIMPLGNDQYLVMLDFHPDLFEMQQQQDADALVKYKEDNATWEVLDEVPYWTNGGSFTNKHRSVLALFDAKTLKADILTDRLTSIDDFDLNKDQDQVVCIGSSFKDLQSLYNSLFLIHLKSGLKEDISHKDQFSYAHAMWLDESTIIFNGKDGSSYGMNENGKFYSLKLPQKDVELLTPDWDASAYNSIGSDVKFGTAGSDWQACAHGLAFLATTEHSCNVFAIGENNQVNQLTHFDGGVMEFAVMGDDIVIAGLLDHKPIELYRLPKGQSDAIENLTQFNAKLNEDYPLSIPEQINFTTADGTDLTGWIMKPIDFNEARRYPTILNIHGGPKTVYGSVYYHEMQYWAQEGFVVIFCNPRGSDGKGNAFADIRGKYGSIDYEDLMAFVDEAIRRYDFIDINRMGVTGGSYGGFMTNWIVGHTDRFKAAATQRSISNWVSMFGTTDIGYFFVPDQVAADPWTNIQKCWDLSPLKYADQIKTPLLVLHSEQDYRCWLTEGLQMFTAMKYNGVPSKMVMFRGENHELSRSGKPKNRVKRLKEITDWFTLYLKSPAL